MKVIKRFPLLSSSIWLLMLIAIAYLSLFRPGIATFWKQQPLPPEPFSHLALGDASEMLAYTSDGVIYELDYRIGFSPEWVKVSQPSGNPVIWNCGTTDYGHIVWPPPGNVKSRLVENCVIIESAYHIELVLLDNGEVWMWEHESYAYTELVIMIALSCGFLAGIPGLLTGFSMVFRKKKNPSSGE